MYLQQLLTIIGKEREREIPTCVTDLVGNGLSQDRFTDEEYRPGRHDITLFLAAWCHRIGLEAEAYRDWLIDYSLDVLGVISSSSPSQIRHSTKSTIKFVHRSDVAFSCHCERNIFKAVCMPTCLLYGEMETLYKQELDIKRKRLEEDKRIKEEGMPILERLTVKQQYKEQFEEAVEHIQKYLMQGRTRNEIVDLLNEKGYKTRTGREWKTGSISGIAIERG
ncbi:MAG: recombinase family protein [Thermodesulfobacteriota bacterium]|nr:recombinase family protein [Thermodesulfobacteriota bacterium]